MTSKTDNFTNNLNIELNQTQNLISKDSPIKKSNKSNKSNLLKEKSTFDEYQNNELDVEWLDKPCTKNKSITTSVSPKLSYNLTKHQKHSALISSLFPFVSPVLRFVQEGDKRKKHV